MPDVVPDFVEALNFDVREIDVIVEFLEALEAVNIMFDVVCELV